MHTLRYLSKCTTRMVVSKTQGINLDLSINVHARLFDEVEVDAC